MGNSRLYPSPSSQCQCHCERYIVGTENEVGGSVSAGKGTWLRLTAEFLRVSVNQSHWAHR